MGRPDGGWGGLRVLMNQVQAQRCPRLEQAGSGPVCWTSTDLFAVGASFLWQTTETVLEVRPWPGSSSTSHSAESLARTALNTRPGFTATLQDA